MIKEPYVGMRADAVLRRTPFGGRVLECGIWWGNMSMYMLAKRPDISLVMVDPWKATPAYPQTEQKELNGLKKMAYDVTRFASDRRTIHEEKILDIIEKYPDEYFDVIFLDGDHRYESVKEEIQACYGKVKINGWLGGHDYGKPSIPHCPVGVQQAVDEWMAERNRTDLHLDEESTWFVPRW